MASNKKAASAAKKPAAKPTEEGKAKEEPVAQTATNENPLDASPPAAQPKAPEKPAVVEKPVAQKESVVELPQPTEETARIVKPIAPNAFGYAKAKYRQMSATVDPDLTIDDLEDSKLWVNIARDVSVGDEVRVIATDTSWMALMLVVYANGTKIRTKFVYGVETAAYEAGESPTDGENYKVEHRGPVDGWCVVQSDNNEVVIRNLPARSAAYKQLEDLEKALVA